MGITGLIPFLDKSSRPANVKEFAGCCVAIDAYCWLHKGVFGCAEQLILNEPTTMYVSYCMKYVNMLLSHNIKPILVFDGQNLPAKLQTEKKRRETREINRRKGQELLRAGRVAEGRNFLRRAVDVTHEMALQLMKECRRRNVDCIVAPYEADSQLAYFNIQDIAQVVITEDSDLLLFGCKAVLFKMDHNGNGLLIEQSKIALSMGMRNDAFSIDKFRLMCILSGCDYIDSLPGVGLAKACRFVNRTSQTKIASMLQKLSSNLNMKSVAVTEEYRQGVLKADHTFRCQLVYDPLKRRQVPLMEPEEGESPVGEVKDSETAYQLALGNLHPKDLKKVGDYDPDDKPTKSLSRMEQAIRAPHSSIWRGNFSRTAKRASDLPTIYRKSTCGDAMQVSVCPPAVKRGNVYDADPSHDEDYILKLYTSKRHQSCKVDQTPNESALTSRYFAGKKKSDNPNNLKSPTSGSSNLSPLVKQNEDYIEDGDSFLDGSPEKSSDITQPPVQSSRLSDCASSNEEDSAVDSPSDEKKADEEFDSAYDSIPSSSEGGRECPIADDAEIIHADLKLPLMVPLGVEDAPVRDNPTKGLKLFQFKSTLNTPKQTELFSGANALSNSCHDLDTVGTRKSIYFGTSNGVQARDEAKSSTPIRKATTRTVAKRVGLSRPKSSSQSLLTTFGFQTRPKLN